jgi:sugar O-acyltransferase (sialic acid O-acetyltransferase NeuD family)
MILYGASGHGKVISDIVKSNNDSISHFFDDNESLVSFEGIAVSKYSKDLFIEEKIIISIGNNSIRKSISKGITHKFGTAIHSSSIVSSSSNQGKGSVIMQGAILQANVQLGNHVIINTGASIDHDCILENFVHVSPNATLCGNIFIGEGSHIGAGAVLIPGIKIGKWCTIGAGAVVIENVPDNAVVVGNPGKIIKFNTNNI